MAWDDNGMSARIVNSTYLHSLWQKAFHHGFMLLHLRNANIMLFVCFFFAIGKALVQSRSEWESVGVRLKSVMYVALSSAPLPGVQVAQLNCKGKYSEGLGFESSLDSRIFLKGCYLTLLAKKNIIHQCLLLLKNIQPLVQTIFALHGRSTIP